MRLKRFEKHCLCLVLVVLLAALGIGPTFGAKGIPPGTTLPAFTMDMPDSAEARKYLGIKEAKTFTLSDISGKLVLVEFYSMYCPVCQRQAPRTNKIYKFIQDDPVLNKDIKVIGVGLTNKQQEIDIYKKTFRVDFPLIADPQKAIAEKTGIKDIPMTVLVDKKGKVLISHLGVIDKMDEFLKEIRELQKKQ
jgi:peroxiredoxin